MSLKKVKEIIVVEGRYDKNAVSQAVDAVILETDGFGVFSEPEKVALMRRLGEKRGIILLTDSDGAGFLIRGHLKGRLGDIPVKMAYIPDRPGKEKRKRRPSREGKLGVEGMDRETILEALTRAGATFEGENTEEKTAMLTMADLYELGLTGRPNSARARIELCRRLDLPERLTPQALLQVLNTLYGREELIELLSRDRP